MRQSHSAFLLLALGAIVGCGKKPADEHAGLHAVHEHHAPHGGALQELGEEAAHVELVLDATSGKLTAYVLDGEAERPVRIEQDTLRLKITGLAGGDAAVELKAVANALTGERIGDTSQFEGVSEKLKGVTKFGGSLETITARGIRFDSVRLAFPEGNEQERPDAAK